MDLEMIASVVIAMFFCGAACAAYYGEKWTKELELRRLQRFNQILCGSGRAARRREKQIHRYPKRNPASHTL